MKNIFSKTNKKRNKIMSALTVALIVLTVVLNLLFTYYGQKHTIFADETPEGLYTPTDKFIEECKFLNDVKDENGEKATVKIIFCNDRDYIEENMVSRVTYFVAKRLASVYDNLEIENVNVILNPTAVAKYKTTSLSEILPSDIIVAYGDRYRIMGASKMWVTGSDKTLFSYNGEYRLLGLLKSVTALGMPNAYFVINNGETHYDPDRKETGYIDADGNFVKVTDEKYLLDGFANLLAARGLTIKLLDLSKADRIPDDCALLIINNPKRDFTYDEDRLDEFYYVSDTEKLDRYLVEKQGAIMVNKDYKTTLPVFEDFLHEWGFDFSNAIVKDEVDSIKDEQNTNTQLISKYNSDETSYGYAIYGDFAALGSAPITVFTNAGAIKCAFPTSASQQEQGTPNASKNFVSFLTSSANAQLYSKNDLSNDYTAPMDDTGSYNLAALSIRNEIDTEKDEKTYSYFFCTASDEFFSNLLLNNPVYANYDVLSSLIDNISRIDMFGSMEIGGTSFNSSSFGGKQLVSSAMNEVDKNIFSPDGKEIVRVTKGINTADKVILTVIIFAVPTAIAVLGVVVRIKRKFL